MGIIASAITNTWQLMLPDPEAFLSSSSCTPSVVFTKRLPLPCIERSAIERRSTSSPNLSPAKKSFRFMCSVLFFSRTKNRLVSLHKSVLTIPSLYSMLGEPLIVTFTFFRSGNTYFSESRVPAVYGSVNKSRMAFRDLLWA